MVRVLVLGLPSSSPGRQARRSTGSKLLERGCLLSPSDRTSSIDTRLSRPYENHNKAQTWVRRSLETSSRGRRLWNSVTHQTRIGWIAANVKLPDRGFAILSDSLAGLLGRRALRVAVSRLGVARGALDLPLPCRWGRRRRPLGRGGGGRQIIELVPKRGVLRRDDSQRFIEFLVLLRHPNQLRLETFNLSITSFASSHRDLILDTLGFHGEHLLHHAETTY